MLKKNARPSRFWPISANHDCDPLSTSSTCRQVDPTSCSAAQGFCLQRYVDGGMWWSPPVVKCRARGRGDCFESTNPQVWSVHLTCIKMPPHSLEFTTFIFFFFFPQGRAPLEFLQGVPEVCVWWCFFFFFLVLGERGEHKRRHPFFYPTF